MQKYGKVKKESNHSFAILVYQDLPCLIECIESLINQTVKSEIYISTSTPSAYISKISKKYKIPVYINQNKTGISSDWNFAMNKCRTQYLTLAHQDDIYDHNYTEEMIKQVEKYSDCLIGFSDYWEYIKGKSEILASNYLLNLSY